MSDPYTHPKYDAWKLATPWDDEPEEELKCCEECGTDVVHDHELNDDGLCRKCEDDLLIAEEF